ncbi:MAG: sigma-70 family RNA polymerase sigma factor [Candidatus Gracilibacteria bacterium]
MDNPSPLHSDEIEALVEQSKRGDSDAFGKLYDIFVNPIYRYIYYRVNHQEAEDLTELVFLKTWENINQYKADQKSFSSWIFRIAHNLVVDFYRLHKSSEELVENIKDERREAHASFRANLNLDKEMLGVALGKLKDSYRQILVLKYINDFSNDEIAGITGRSQAALRILQFRALKHLKRILEEMGMHDHEV